MKLPLCSLALAFSTALAAAQAPAKKAPPVEEEIPFPANLPIPEATVLSPEETLQTFKIAPGYRIEIVAAEPLISTPVAMQFDADGRLWVVEMNGYMPNLEGKGEDVPNGRVVILEDTDGDGRMDKSTVFLDKLVMPRAIGLRKGGALIAEPPMLLWCADANSDLVADGKEPLIPNYTAGGNPEHMPNGLLRALDNWIYNAKSAKRYRFLQNGELKTETTLFRGQWGIAQDDFGRLYYDYNSDQLRADLLPASYLTRNSNFKAVEGVNYQIAKSQKTWPGRVTPGVNRGYRKGELLEGRLAQFTAACGPLVYRGDLMPEMRGNSFVCETSANFMKRNVHTEKDGYVEARDAYRQSRVPHLHQRALSPGQHVRWPGWRALLRRYRSRSRAAHHLRQPVAAAANHRAQTRAAAEPGPHLADRAGGLQTRRPLPQLAKAAPEQLVAALGSTNGWTRDTAQRSARRARRHGDRRRARERAKSGKEPLARRHALWTLEGLEKLSAAAISAALDDADGKTARRPSGSASHFSRPTRSCTEPIFGMAKDTDADVAPSAPF